MGKRDMVLKGMSRSKKEPIPRWDTEWIVFGPIPNEGSNSTWPGKIGFSRLPLDAAISIPSEAKILNTVYKPLRVYSTDGKIDFTRVFDNLTGCPICYIMTVLNADKKGYVPVSFGASWGTQWWVNGKTVYESTSGNMGSPDDISINQFLSPVTKGKNIFVCKIIAGTETDWNILIGRLPVTESRGRKIKEVPEKRERVEEKTTDYATTGLRIEHRPGAVGIKESARRAKIMSLHGVQAHWISVVNPRGIPLAPSSFLPSGECTDEKNREKLKRQVAEIHKNGMSAVSWYPAVYSESTALKHPDWKSISFKEDTGRRYKSDSNEKELAGEKRYSLCYNSPYGDALINFVIESIDTYGLDGFWFDGTFLTPGDSPGCACRYCKKKFKADTGLNFPEKIDWENKSYREWVLWRYNDYMAYWARLSGSVHRRFPQARIVVNQLHRLSHSWFAGIPLNPYSGDIIAGTESADSPYVTAFHSRLQRAYQKEYSEIWMGLHKLFTNTEAWPVQSAPINRYMHHAMAALTAGIMPSFGTPDPAEKLSDAYDRLSAVINPRKEFISPDSFKYAGLLLSQQAETFYFSRSSGNLFPQDYWFTSFGMNNLLLESGFLTDIIFDNVIDSGILFEYPVVIAPFSVALSDRQIRTLERYIHEGGLLVTDRYLGAKDEWGCKADHERAKNIIGGKSQMPPRPEEPLENLNPGYEIIRLGSGNCIVLQGNPGLSFYKDKNSELSHSFKDLISRFAPPIIQVKGPEGFNIGMYKKSGRLIVHIQNFIPWSQSESFPNPVLCRPRETGKIKISLRGLRVSKIFMPLTHPQRELRFVKKSETVEFEINRNIGWGEIIEIYQ